jgi:hypothetical protein
LKLVKCLHVRAINVFFTIVFKACLLPYLRLATISLKRNTLIEHKEVVIVCEESGLVSVSYNALLTTPKANVVVNLVVPTITTKSTSTCTNCCKTNHSMETYHSRKRKVLVVLPAIVKSIKHVARTKTLPIKLEKYLFIIPI